MEFGYVNTDYINYLRQHEHRILINKSHRPYLGIVLKFGKYTYFAPLESRKTSKKVNGQVTLKVWGNLDKNEDLLGYLLLNDMIPVTDNNWTPLDFHVFEQSDPKRYLLLLKEWQWVKVNADRIKNKSARVYALRCNRNIPFINSICINYKQLEPLCQQFNSSLGN
ncbi:hypothetical protein MH1LPH_04540 [Lactiplantibacillus brownii]